MTYTPVLKVEELPRGAKKRVVVGDKELCLYHLSDGIFATDNICSHERASLASGWIIDDCQIECPRHGARFDIKTGDVKALPALKHVRTYPVKVEGDSILVSTEPSNPE